MIDMVPKAIMYTLVQYVFTYRVLFWKVYWPFPDSPRMRCNASYSRTCTARTNWTSCSKRVTTRSADEKSANRWWRVFLVPARLSARCSKRKRVGCALYFRLFVCLSDGSFISCWLSVLSCLVVSEVLRCVLFHFHVCMSFRSQVESFFALLTIPLLFLWSEVLLYTMIYWYSVFGE